MISFCKSTHIYLVDQSLLSCTTWICLKPIRFVLRCMMILADVFFFPDPWERLGKLKITNQPHLLTWSTWWRNLCICKLDPFLGECPFRGSRSSCNAYRPYMATCTEPFNEHTYGLPTHDLWLRPAFVTFTTHQTGQDFRIQMATIRLSDWKPSDCQNGSDDTQISARFLRRDRSSICCRFPQPASYPQDSHRSHQWYIQFMKIIPTSNKTSVYSLDGFASPQKYVLDTF